MSHGDFIARLPEGFRACAVTEHCPTGAIADEARGFYGVQFHPEVNHTEHGQDMIRNFLYRVCGCTGTWNMGDYMRSSIAAIREKVGSGKGLLSCPAAWTAPLPPRSSQRPSATSSPASSSTTA